MSKIQISIINDEISEDIDQALDFLALNGVNYVEIRSINGKNILDMDLEQVVEIKHKLDVCKIKVSALCSPLFKRYPYALKHTEKYIKEYDNYGFTKTTSENELMQKAICIAEILETNKIRIFSYLRYEGFKFSDILDSINHFNVLIGDRDINLLLENEPVCNLDDVTNTLDFIRATQLSNLKLLLDIGNLFKIGINFDFNKLSSIIPFCDYFHLKDFSKKSNKYVKLGIGDIDYTKLFSYLKSLPEEYTFVLSLETHTSSSDDVLHSLNYIKGLIK